MLPFLKILARNIAKGPATDPFPFEDTFTPKRLRGRAELDPKRCLTCGICSHVCAGGAIAMTESADGNGMEFRLWHNTCTFCGLCAHYCPANAITMTNDWHLSHKQAEKYTCCEVQFVEYPVCKECGERMLPQLENRLSKGLIGEVDATNILHTCPDCRRRLAALQQINSTAFMTADRS
ncbi:4Fe-4S dicluster domain-containing protein [Pseudodesulfovibrio karagichevae]|uniref:4Fe-4S dicluster domain-containing protein n=1 Tax=Pseudodesulfovibrio karagichevae TaxID=3239305 RepID=A0ABV4JWX4_9BACT